MQETQQTTLTLKCSNIGLLNDGAFGYMVDNELALLMADCDQRAGLEKARKLTIVISIVPRPKDEGYGGAKGLDVKGTVKHALPVSETHDDYMPLQTTVNSRGQEEFTAFLPSVVGKDQDLFNPEA